MGRPRAASLEADISVAGFNTNLALQCAKSPLAPLVIRSSGTPKDQISGHPHRRATLSGLGYHW